jgi:hypothetical protein
MWGFHHRIPIIIVLVTQHHLPPFPVLLRVFNFHFRFIFFISFAFPFFRHLFSLPLFLICLPVKTTTITIRTIIAFIIVPIFVTVLDATVITTKGGSGSRRCSRVRFIEVPFPLCLSRIQHTKERSVVGKEAVVLFQSHIPS